MSNKSAGDKQQKYSPNQTSEMLKNFQTAVLAASDHLLRLVSTLNYIYGAAAAGHGEMLKSTLQGYDTRLMENFEDVLDVFRQRGIPILEEYNDLLPFILETQLGIQMTVEQDNDGAYLRRILAAHGDLSTFLETLLPVEKLVQRPKKKSEKRQQGRPQDAVNEYIGHRANELRELSGTAWSQVLDSLIVQLSNAKRDDLEERALQKLLGMKIRLTPRRAGDHLSQIARNHKP